MGLNQSWKLFMIAGVGIFLTGYFLYIKELGDLMGTLFMISGSSLVIASLVELIMRKIYFLRL